MDAISGISRIPNVCTWYYAWNQPKPLTPATTPKPEPKTINKKITAAEKPITDGYLWRSNGEIS